MHPLKTISVSIRRPFQAVYDFLAKPKNFPLWAAGLGKMTQEGNGQWVTETEQGLMTLLFTNENPFGIVDHYVIPPTGDALYIPMRVIANDGSADVLFTLFKTAEMTDVIFERDAGLIEADLNTLKTHLEAQTL